LLEQSSDVQDEAKPTADSASSETALGHDRSADKPSAEPAPKNIELVYKEALGLLLFDMTPILESTVPYRYRAVAASLVGRAVSHGRNSRILKELTALSTSLPLSASKFTPVVGFKDRVLDCVR
jgi:hypothetical protein